MAVNQTVRVYTEGKTPGWAGNVMTPNDQGKSTTCSRHDLFLDTWDLTALRPVFEAAKRCNCIVRRRNWKTRRAARFNYSNPPFKSAKSLVCMEDPGFYFSTSKRHWAAFIGMNKAPPITQSSGVICPWSERVKYFLVRKRPSKLVRLPLVLLLPPRFLDLIQ